MMHTAKEELEKPFMLAIQVQANKPKLMTIGVHPRHSFCFM
jgi:hypothetical protein